MMRDEDLLAAWRQGDRKAGEQLFTRHFETVRRFFVNKVQDDPEELIQLTFMACVEGRDRIVGTGFRAYLLGIARNLLRRHWEQRRGRRTEDIDELPIADLGAGASSILARDRTEKRLLDALRRIPLAQQEILEFAYWEQLTGTQIGELLGVSEDTARTRLRRAKIALGKEYRRLERFAGIPESSDADIEQWAASIRGRLLVPGDS